MGKINLASILTKVNDTFTALGYKVSENDIETDESCDIVTLWGRVGEASGLDNDNEDKHLEFVTNGKECFLRLDIVGSAYDEKIEIFRSSYKDIKKTAEIFVYMMNENNPKA